ncbi:hypothetical protein DPMN_125931 [Dreissena polymorpha]|uniref:Uncharacterized protein n=1 Tax=Dreissena polymorpha TaxID=45954 RepID=A0A9D4JXN1_DREPO|nr:hypothetical protein DPMN_125931 [Dreissena polymorpha]
MWVIIFSCECKEIDAIKWYGEYARVWVIGVAFVEDYALELNGMVWTKIGDIMVQKSGKSDRSNHLALCNKY